MRTILRPSPLARPIPLSFVGINCEQRCDRASSGLLRGPSFTLFSVVRRVRVGAAAPDNRGTMFTQTRDLINKPPGLLGLPSGSARSASRCLVHQRPAHFPGGGGGG